MIVHVTEEDQGDLAEMSEALRDEELWVVAQAAAAGELRPLALVCRRVVLELFFRDRCRRERSYCWLGFVYACSFLLPLLPLSRALLRGLAGPPSLCNAGCRGMGKAGLKTGYCKDGRRSRRAICSS